MADRSGSEVGHQDERQKKTRWKGSRSGWDKERVVTEPEEIAETMQSQYESKEKEVEAAVRKPIHDSLTPVRLATTGNTRIFEYRSLTEKEVARKIENVPNKQSFGYDEISYGVLKKVAKWIVPELTT